MIFLDIYRCPLDYLFGIPCALCGATRAFICAFTGRFGEAFYYHPLWPVFIIAGVLFILYFFGIIKVKKTTREAAIIILITLLLACYIIRHIMHSPVVSVHFNDAFFYRIVKNIKLTFAAASRLMIA